MNSFLRGREGLDPKECLIDVHIALLPKIKFRQCGVQCLDCQGGGAGEASGGGQHPSVEGRGKLPWEAPNIKDHSAK